MSHIRLLARRKFLKLMGLGVAGGVLAGCTPQVVEKVVKETVVVEKPVEKVVEREVTKVVEKVVKETVLVEGTPKVVERVVKETVVVEAKPAPQERVTLRYFTPWPRLRLDKMQPHFDEFIATHPNINLVIDEVTWDVWAQKLSVTMAGGVPPDCSLMDSRAASLYMDSGVCMELGSRFEADGINHDDYLTVGYETWCDGKWYLAPFIAILGVMMYNPVMFKEYGIPDPWEEQGGTDWTWEDFRNTLKMATRGEGMQRTWGIHWQPWRAYRNLKWPVYGNGGRWWRADTWRYTLTEPKNLEATDWVMEMYHEDGSIVPASDASQLESAMGMSPFAAQRCAMAWDDTGDISHLVATADFPFAIAPMPKRDKSADPPPIHLHTDNHFVPTESSQPDAAYEFVKMIALPGMQTTIGIHRLHCPALKSVGLDKEGIYAKPPPAHIDYLVEHAAGESSPVFVNPTLNEQNRIWEGYMDRILLKEMSVEEALSAAEDEMNELLASNETSCNWEPRCW